MNDDKCLALLREAFGSMKDETLELGNNREGSIVVTKIQEAILWRQQQLQERKTIDLKSGN